MNIIPRVYADFSLDQLKFLNPVTPDTPGTLLFDANGKLDLAKVANLTIDTLTLIAGILAVVYLVYMGILYITAGGDDEKAGLAKKGIVNAVIGIIVIVLAYALAKYIAQGIFGATPPTTGEGGGGGGGGTGGGGGGGEIPGTPGS